MSTGREDTCHCGDAVWVHDDNTMCFNCEACLRCSSPGNVWCDPSEPPAECQCEWKEPHESDCTYTARLSAWEGKQQRMLIAERDSLRSALDEANADRQRLREAAKWRQHSAPEDPAQPCDQAGCDLESIESLREQLHLSMGFEDAGWVEVDIARAERNRAVAALAARESWIEGAKTDIEGLTSELVEAGKRWAFKASELADAVGCIQDIAEHANPIAKDADGFVSVGYTVTVGAVHRAIAWLQGAYVRSGVAQPAVDELAALAGEGSEQ